MELFQIGADACRGLDSIVRLIKKGLFPIIQIGIPILLIVMGTIDLGKAVISSDEKEVKSAQKRLIQRFIYAAAIFLVVTLVQVVMGIVAKGGQGNTTGWQGCWDAAIVEHNIK